MNFIQTAITVFTLAISLNGQNGVRAGNAGNVGGSGAPISQNQTVGTSNNTSNAVFADAAGAQFSYGQGN